MSASAVFEHMLSLKPGLMIMLGDFHYSGHSMMTPDQFKFAVHEQMKSPAIRQLYTSMPVTYVLDDHDLGENNADGRHRSAKDAYSAHAEIFPGSTERAYDLAGARVVQTDARKYLNSDKGKNLFGPN